MVSSVLQPKDQDVYLSADRERPLSLAALTLLKEPIRLELRRQLRVTMNRATMRQTGDRLRSAVVREAFLHLFGVDRFASEFRHFVLIAAPLMRELLLRDAAGSIHACEGLDAFSLDVSLRRLDHLAPRQARMVDLLYFAGLTLRETAELLDLSEPVLKRELRFIKAWLANTRRHPTPDGHPL